ncbi:DMT family transporter [Acinetobacter puyangensis]|uniref:DMT family transporter n=1 Tax=Acinetobacter puyangensis TaxID=1096779 RepID=UPI003A4E297B
MDQRKSIDTHATMIMIMLCAIWGIQQVAIKGIATEISPALQIAIRSIFAAFLLWVLMIYKKEYLTNSLVYYKSGLVIGVLATLEFFFIAEGLRYTSASHMAVFLYTAPIFAAIGLQIFLPEEKLALLQWGGIVTAFSGVVIAFLFGQNLETGNLNHIILGDFFGLLAGLSWGLTTVVIRSTSLNNIPATHTLFYQLACAGGLLLLYACFSQQYHVHLSMTSSLSMLFQIIVVAFLSYLTWFKLLKKYFASQLGVLSFLTPIFGVLAGVIMLGEKLELSFILGSCLILTGIFIVNSYPWMKRKFDTR